MIEPLLMCDSAPVAAYTFRLGGGGRGSGILRRASTARCSGRRAQHAAEGSRGAVPGSKSGGQAPAAALRGPPRCRGAR